MLSKNLDNFQTNEIIEIISNKRVDLSTTNQEKIVLENILKKLNDIKEIEYHRLIADRQKSAYNKMIKSIDLFTNSIVIEVKNFII